MIFLMNLNGEVGKRKHIPVSGYGAVQSSHVPQLQVQSACLDIYTYWSLLSLSTEKYTWSSELQQINWVLTAAIGNWGDGGWVLSSFFF